MRSTLGESDILWYIFLVIFTHVHIEWIIILNGIKH